MQTCDACSAALIFHLENKDNLALMLILAILCMRSITWAACATTKFIIS